MPLSKKGGVFLFCAGLVCFIMGFILAKLLSPLFTFPEDMNIIIPLAIGIGVLLILGLAGMIAAFYEVYFIRKE